MLKALITSEARIKLLLKFFLNPNTTGYLRQLAADFNESTNGIRVELNKLTEADILTSEKSGRNVIYKANSNHPLFNEIRNIVLKSTGIDKVVLNIIKKIGQIHSAFIRGDYAMGKDTGLIDLVIVGDTINASEVERVRIKTEKLISRKIVIFILKEEEFKLLKDKFFNEKYLLLLENNRENQESNGI